MKKRSHPLAGGAGSLRGGALLGAGGVELAALIPAGGLTVLAPTPLHRVDDANGLLAVGARLEEHLTVAEREEGVILASADAGARVNLKWTKAGNKSAGCTWNDVEWVFGGSARGIRRVRRVRISREG